MRMMRGLLAGGMLVMAATAARAQEVFVVDATYSLRPDGVCQELTGGAFGGLAKKNAHWDAATKTIRLTAAKNEEASVQIIIPQAGTGFSGKMSDLKGPGAIPANSATFSALIWVVDVNKKLSPDLVIPLDGSVKDIRTFDVPVAFEGLPKAANTVGAMLFEVWVPKTTAAGLYKGTVSVLKGGVEVAKLPLELTVLDMALPDAPTFAFDLLDYAMPAGGLGYKDALNGNGLGVPATKMSDAAKAANYQIYKLAADNRCFINILPYGGSRGNPKFAAPIIGKGTQAKVMSWTEFDDLFAPILDGKCNKFGLPPAHFTLAFNANYPHVCDGEVPGQFDWRPFATTMPEGPGKTPELKEFEDTNKTIAQEYIRHFAEKGWKKTRFEVYHNQKANPQRNKLPWKLDEPVAKPDYQALGYFFNTAHWAFDGAATKGVQVVTRIDIGHFHCNKLLTPDGKTTACWKAKAYDTGDAPKYLKGPTDHWVIGINHAESAQPLLKDYEAPGKKVMVYGTAGEGELQGHFGGYASACVKLAKVGAVGMIVYKVDLAAGNPNGPARDYVLYNGKTSLGYDGALASRRLKLWRDSVNTYDYIEAARKKNPAAVEALLDKMVRVGLSSDKDYRTKSKSRGYWASNNVEDYTTFKLKLAELATGTKLGAGELGGFSDTFTPNGVADAIVGYD